MIILVRDRGNETENNVVMESDLSTIVMILWQVQDSPC
jgi:hypothetical protein